MSKKQQVTQYGIQDLQHNDGMQVHKATVYGPPKEPIKGIVLKNLKDLKVPGMDWKQVQQLLTDGKVCARRKSWPVSDFMFCHQGSSKYINEKTTAGTFYEPITMKFLQKHKLRGFTVQSHYNRWRYKTAILQVGFFPSAEDRDNNDWEVYIP